MTFSENDWGWNRGRNSRPSNEFKVQTALGDLDEQCKVRTRWDSEVQQPYLSDKVQGHISNGLFNPHGFQIL